MLFNSVEFVLFFAAVFFLYWTVFSKSLPLRNWFLLLTSYLFYGLWDWRFLSLIVISSIVDFYVGKQVGSESNSTKKKKKFLWISILVNIGILGFFKYFNFFIDSFVDSFNLVGISISRPTLNIILPVGISFYTFQTMSYTLDIYKGKLKPINNVVQFLTFVSFFPQLVAGPIERAKDLLPQFSSLKKPDYDSIRSGFLLILWGLFKKIVIADRISIFVDTVFPDTNASVGLASTIALVFFAFQLYIDFSAYSEIAIGIARTLGFKLSTNFKSPYLASTFSSFWSKWHISLSTWFRDYLYIPLGGNKNGKFNTYKNVLIVFAISGLWHGASWNFVIWGVLNALFLILLDPLLSRLNKMQFGKLISPIIVFSCWTISLAFFRAKTFHDAIDVISNIGTSNAESIIQYGLNNLELKIALGLIAFVLAIEFLQVRFSTISNWFFSTLSPIRWVAYLFLIAGIIFYGSYGATVNDNSFIYFQF